AVISLPEELDKLVAKYKLESMGVKIDALTDEQARYLNSWNIEGEATGPTLRTLRSNVDCLNAARPRRAPEVRRSSGGTERRREADGAKWK
ncbi:MAG: adenosylhomocysteinase, partial [Clostridiales bacterium]|nr:adenosylhomocysteinase [Clostridiales bacterium]